MRPIAAIIILLVVLITACKKGKSSSEPAPAPGKVTLLLPALNATCTLGAITSSTESTVSLSWNASANTETYDIYLKNLLTGVETIKAASASVLTVNLTQNTPYSWYVLSKSSQTSVTTKSDVWKFYNAGVAASFYAPFPAELLSPVNDQSVSAVAGKIVLDWTGSDVDNDIAGYDVFMGTTSTNMALVKTNSTESIANDIAVVPGSIYYWKIVTKDSKGNTSASDIYQFKVN